MINHSCVPSWTQNSSHAINSSPPEPQSIWQCWTRHVKNTSEPYLQPNLLLVLKATCQQNALHVSFLQGTCQQLRQDSTVWKKTRRGHAAHVNAHQALVALPLCKGLSFQCWVQRHQIVQLCLYASFWLLKSHLGWITIVLEPRPAENTQHRCWHTQNFVSRMHAYCAASIVKQLIAAKQ